MMGDGMVPAGIDTGVYASTDYKTWKLTSKKPVRNQQLTVYLCTAQTSTQQQWNEELDSLVKDAAVHSRTAQDKTRQWWQQFWNRSYVFIEGPDSIVSRNYQ